jgi:hypothetical protein
MRKLAGWVDCGTFTIRLWKDYNFPISLEIILEYSHLKEEEKVPVYDLKKKLRALDIRTLEIYDSGVINVLLYDNIDCVLPP